MPHSLNLRIAYLYRRHNGRVPASRAIIDARADVAANRVHHPRPVKWSRFGAVDTMGARWTDDPKANGFRFVGTAFDLIGNPRGATGWFTDIDQSEKTFGEVWRLPSRNGRPLYVAAIIDPDNNGRAFFLGKHDVEYGSIGGEDDDTPRDVARFADSRAERYAENEREYQTAWQAGNRWREAKEERGEVRRRLLALIAETRKACPSLDQFAAIKATIRDTIERGREEMSDLLDRMDRLAEGDEKYFEFYPSPRLVDAFNEGREG